MFNPPNSLRLLLSVTTAIGFALPAYAQDVSATTPPARVGQIAGVSGDVSYNGAGSNGQWIAATANYPVTAGDSLFTESGAQAALALDSSRLTLGPNTEMQVTGIDENNLTATESQGEIFLNLANLQPGQSFTINTPRGAVNIDENGEYDVAAGDANDPTTVSVLVGNATVGPLQIPAGQEGYLSGTNQIVAQLGPLQRNDFMDHVLAEMAPPPPPYVPPAVLQMTGVNELSNYGVWSQDPQYGAVWYPAVGPDWAPYREGHWAYVTPWGWTWVDVEPWGFAPFHYGRWIDDDSRWGWVPAAAYDGGYGPAYQPVYAPAVVGFFGLGVGVAITASILASGSVGWVPLAPDEPYYPHYHADPDYMRRINRMDVRNYNGTRENIRNYANRRDATYIPAADMVRGAPVSRYGHPVPQGMFDQARPAGSDFNQVLRPNIAHHEAPAPQLSDFAQRHNVPPAMISRQPVPQGMRPQDMQAPQGQPFHPQPQQQFHPQMPQVVHPQTPVQPFHPQPQQQFHPQMPQVVRPQTPVQPFHPQPQQQFHPQMPQVVRPQTPVQPFHPQPQQQFHPQMPQVVHPQTPVQQFHMQGTQAPQGQQFHMQPQQQFHPQMEMPHTQPAPHPGGGDQKSRPR